MSPVRPAGRDSAQPPGIVRPVRDRRQLSSCARPDEEHLVDQAMRHFPHLGLIVADTCSRRAIVRVNSASFCRSTWARRSVIKGPPHAYDTRSATQRMPVRPCDPPGQVLPRDPDDPAYRASRRYPPGAPLGARPQPNPHREAPPGPPPGAALLPGAPTSRQSTSGWANAWRK